MNSICAIYALLMRLRRSDFRTEEFTGYVGTTTANSLKNPVTASRRDLRRAGANNHEAIGGFIVFQATSTKSSRTIVPPKGFRGVKL